MKSKYQRLFVLNMLIGLGFLLFATLSCFGEKISFIAGILEKGKIYCQRLERASFEFFCQEEISEVFFLKLFSVDYKRTFNTNIHNHFVYDYQLVKNEGDISEKRILLIDNGQVKNEDNAPLKTRYYHKFIVLGPYGILAEHWQGYFNFKINKRFTYRGRPVTILEAAPKPGYKVDHLWGRIWIDEQDSSIIKIEWDQNNFKNFESLQAMAAKFSAKPAIRLVSEFDVIKNNIRFPSRFTIQVHLIGATGVIHKSETVVKYKNYRFFNVKTQVQYTNN